MSYYSDHVPRTTLDVMVKNMLYYLEILWQIDAHTSQVRIKLRQKHYAETYYYLSNGEQMCCEVAMTDMYLTSQGSYLTIITETERILYLNTSLRKFNS